MPLKIVRQDITKIKCDAVVNPTNENMIPTGGTDLAIHNAAGEKLLERCKKLGGCEVGKAKVTPGFNLPCKYVIHTVGPVWIDGNHGEKELLINCYKECLALSKKKRCKSVAIPLISSGTYGYPKDKVLKVALDTVSEFLFENEMTVYVVVYDKSSYEISKSLFSDIQSFISDNIGEAETVLTTEILGTNRTRFIADVKSNIDDNGTDDSVPDSMLKHRRVKSKKSFLGGWAKEDYYCDDSAEDADAEDLSPTVFKAFPAVEEVSEIEKKHVTFKKSKSLADMLKEMDKSFSELLFYYIDLKGISDVQCYKKANVDKKTFSKIKCKKDYKPSKQTALSFAIALELNLEETERLLQTVGMSLSNSNKFDVIVKYFIINGRYNIFEINETLFEFDQMLLGSV